jgi:beta-phosphoglucomutase
MHTPSAILFDFDGVIVHSEPLYCDAYVQTLNEFGIPLTPEQYYRDLIGFDDKGAIHHIFHLHNRPIDQALFTRVFDRKQELITQLMRAGTYHALPGVDRFIRTISRTHPIAICSGAMRSEIETMLDGIRLRELFPIIVAADDVDVGKPDPRGYLLAARLLSSQTGRDLAPGDCLIIEDAPSVARTTSAVGFRVMGVTNTFPREAFSHAHFVVDSLEIEHIRTAIPGLLLD